MKTLSQKRRVLNYMATGRGITSAEAKSRFGVVNLRAVMTAIRHQVERYGNYRITTEQTTTGRTRYFMKRVMLTSPVCSGDMNS